MSNIGKYECKTVSLSKLIITPKGELKPLCNSCVSPDCENPIEEKSISVFGLIEKYKVYVGGIDDRIVVQCLGYINKNDKATLKTIIEGDD